MKLTPQQVIKEIKAIRVEQDELNGKIQQLLESETVIVRMPIVAELVTAGRRGKEVRHWLGECLAEMREAFPNIAGDHPYPHADNPENTNISPTADTAKSPESKG